MASPKSGEQNSQKPLQKESQHVHMKGRTADYRNSRQIRFCSSASTPFIPVFLVMVFRNVPTAYYADSLSIMTRKCRTRGQRSDHSMDMSYGSQQKIVEDKKKGLWIYEARNQSVENYSRHQMCEIISTYKIWFSPTPSHTDVLSC